MELYIFLNSFPQTASWSFVLFPGLGYRPNVLEVSNTDHSDPCFRRGMIADLEDSTKKLPACPIVDIKLSCICIAFKTSFRSFDILLDIEDCGI